MFKQRKSWFSQCMSTAPPQSLTANLHSSDPDSPKYGQHLSGQEIIDLFAPDAQSADKVKSWLVASGVSEDAIQVSGSRGWIHFNTTAGQLGEMLRTEYHHYTIRDASEAALGTDTYSLPNDIAPLVEFVHPATSLKQVKTSKATRVRTFSSINDTIDSGRLQFLPGQEKEERLTLL